MVESARIHSPKTRRSLRTRLMPFRRWRERELAVLEAEAIGLRRVRPARTPWYWWLFRIASLLLIVVAISGAYLYQAYTDPRQLRALLMELMHEVVISEVTIDEASFTFAGGLEVRGIEIYALPRLGTRGRGERIVSVPTLEVVPDWWATLGSIVRLDPQPHFSAIRVIEPELYVRFDADGTLIDEAILRASPDDDDEDDEWRVPPIEIRHARLTVEHPQFFSREVPHRIDDLSVSLQPTERRDIMAIRGVSDSESWGRFFVGGTIDLAQRHLRIESANRRLTVNRGVLSQLAPELRGAIEDFIAISPAWIERYAPELEPHLEVEIGGGVFVAPGRPAGIDIRIAVIDANLAFREFPVPVSEVTGKVVLTNRPYPGRPQLNESWNLATFLQRDPRPWVPADDEEPGSLWTHVSLRGSYGQGRTHLDVLVTGLDTDRPEPSFSVRARNVLVDDAFVDALHLSPQVSSGLRELFETFRPFGFADADFIIPARSDPHLTVWMRDVQAEFAGFPMPMFRGKGILAGWQDSWSLEKTEALPVPRSGPVHLEMPNTVLYQDGSFGMTVNVSSPIIDMSPELYEALPIIGKEIVRDYDIRGRGRLHVSTFQTQSGGEIDFSLEIEPIEMHVNWNQLPYPLVAHAGRIRISKDGVSFHEVRGRARYGPAELTLDGDIRFYSDTPELELDVEARNIPFDDQIWAAMTPRLPAGEAPLFDASALMSVRDMFQPAGRMNVRGEIRGRRTIQLTLHADLDDAEAAYEFFPLPIKKINGQIVVKVHGTAAHIHVRGVQGRYESARLWADGTIQIDESEMPAMDLTIHAEGIEIGHDALLRSTYEEFEAQWLQGEAEPGDEAQDGPALHTPVAAEFVEPAPPPPPLYGPPLPPGWGEPNVGTDEEASEPFRLFELFSAPPDPELPSDAPRPGTTGTFDLTLHLGPGDDPSQAVHPVIEGNLRGMSVIFAPLPYRLEDVRGRVVLDGAEVTLHDIRGRNGPSQVTIADGKVTAGGWEMRVVGRNMLFNSELERALPEGVKPLYDVLDPTGRFDFAGIVQSRSNYAGDWVMQYDAEVLFHDSDVSAGLRFENLRGSAEVKGSMTEHTHTAIGRVRVHEGQWRGMKAHRVTFDIQYDDEVFSVANVMGRSYGGYLRGAMRIDTRPQGPYTGFFQTTAIDVGRLLREAFPESARLQGILDGELTISGKLAGEDPEQDEGTFRGTGAFSILEGEIFDVPLVLKLFDFANWDRPTPIDEVQAAFTMGEVGFDFSRFDMISDALALYGRGMIGYDFDMDMRFTMDFAPRLNLSSPIRSVIRFIEETLIPIYVTGTIYEPIIQPVFRDDPE